MQDLQATCAAHEKTVQTMIQQHETKVERLLGELGKKLERHAADIEQHAAILEVHDTSCDALKDDINILNGVVEPLYHFVPDEAVSAVLF